MKINFEDNTISKGYHERLVNKIWYDTIKNEVDFTNKLVADIGCGGGIYSKVIAQLGAKQVTGIDYSEKMIANAKEHCKEYSNISFIQGSADNTNLSSSSQNIILERAFIHHLESLESNFLECYRILKKEGLFIIQDRTPDDIKLKGSEEHIRGYFFELYPHLFPIDTKRRFSSESVNTALKNTNFTLIKEFTLWETRRIYSSIEDLESDLMNRTGRSILYELSNDELRKLTDYIIKSVTPFFIKNNSYTEQDRWTIWIAKKE